jgi:hypothetical protein
MLPIPSGCRWARFGHEHGDHHGDDRGELRADVEDAGQERRDSAGQLRQGEDEHEVEESSTGVTRSVRSLFASSQRVMAIERRAPRKPLPPERGG